MTDTIATPTTDPVAEPDETLQSTVRRFAQTPEPLLLDTAISAGAVRLWGVLDRTAQRASLFPGREHLATKMDVSLATIDRQLAELAKGGWLTIRRRGLGLTNLYTLHDHPQGRGNGAATGEDSDPSPVRTPNLSPVANKREQDQREQDQREGDIALFVVSDEPPPTDPLAGFEEFWAEYPRKVSKAGARKAWPKAVKAAGYTERIRLAARAYALECTQVRREGQFIAHPTTWLNQERWEDQMLDAPPRPGDRPMSQDRESGSGRVQVTRA